MGLFRKKYGYEELCRLPFGGGISWCHLMGATHPVNPGDLNDGEFYIADSFDDLDMSNGLLMEDLSNGWIDEKGNFWGCEHGRHEYLASRVLKVPGCLAEERQWIKISNRAKWYNTGAMLERSVIGFYQVGNHLQRATMCKMGLDPDDPNAEPEKKTFLDVFPGGYDKSLLPPVTGRRASLEEARELAGKIAPGFFTAVPILKRAAPAPSGP